jgi:hypothetical protein
MPEAAGAATGRSRRCIAVLYRLSGSPPPSENHQCGLDPRRRGVGVRLLHGESQPIGRRGIQAGFSTNPETIERAIKVGSITGRCGCTEKSVTFVTRLTFGYGDLTPALLLRRGFSGDASLCRYRHDWQSSRAAVARRQSARSPRVLLNKSTTFGRSNRVHGSSV